VNYQFLKLSIEDGDKNEDKKWSN